MNKYKGQGLIILISRMSCEIKQKNMQTYGRMRTGLVHSTICYDKRQCNIQRYESCRYSIFYIHTNADLINCPFGASKHLLLFLSLHTSKVSPSKKLYNSNIHKMESVLCPSQTYCHVCQKICNTSDCLSFSARKVSMYI